MNLVLKTKLLAVEWEFCQDVVGLCFSAQLIYIDRKRRLFLTVYVAAFWNSRG
ncbi:uncharacterized protein DS421_6g188160 [Arachis hypogaea]|nr:uncharacterized protein DS421_6g188160 [Arachis hypogaea]